MPADRIKVSEYNAPSNCRLLPTAAAVAQTEAHNTACRRPRQLTAELIEASDGLCAARPAVACQTPDADGRRGLRRELRHGHRRRDRDPDRWSSRGAGLQGGRECTTTASGGDCGAGVEQRLNAAAPPLSTSAPIVVTTVVRLSAAGMTKGSRRSSSKSLQKRRCLHGLALLAAQHRWRPVNRHGAAVRLRGEPTTG